MADADCASPQYQVAGNNTKDACFALTDEIFDVRQPVQQQHNEALGDRGADESISLVSGESDSSRDRSAYRDLAYRAAVLTSCSDYSDCVMEGRKVLSEAVKYRAVPGLNDSGDVSVDDCMASYYISEACKNLGQANGQHYYRREALTLVETFVLRLQKVQQHSTPQKYQAAGCDPHEVLETWARDGARTDSET